MTESFLPADDPDSISFQDSLRFFRQQLDDFQMTTEDTPAEEDAPRCRRMSIPTVDSILESVRVLRAIQKNQREQSLETTPAEFTMKGVFNSCENTVMEEILNISNEKSNFWPKHAVEAKEACSNKENLEKSNLSCNGLKHFTNTIASKSGALSHQVGLTICKDEHEKSLSVEHRTESVSDCSIAMIQNQEPGETADIDFRNGEGSPLELFNLQTEWNPELGATPLGDSLQTGDSSKSGEDCGPGDTLSESSRGSPPGHSNSVPESVPEVTRMPEDSQGDGVACSKKFTTSSWDLVALVKLLCTMEELPPPQVGAHLECEEHDEGVRLQSEVRRPLKCHQDVVIIDLGSCCTRAGILMDQPTLPALFFPSVCATNKTTGEHVYGVEALEPSERQKAAISFPLRASAKIAKHSVDVEQVGGLFRKVFRDLHLDHPQDFAVLVCLPRSLSVGVRRALVALLLEDLGVRAVSLSHQAILTLYAHDVCTGVVLDIGDRMDILPVVDGFVVEGGVARLPHGGRRLVHHMKHALAQKHISLSNDLDSFVVEYISEKLSYVAEDYEKEASLPLHALSRGLDLTPFARDEACPRWAVLDEARFKVPEGLFQPELWGVDSPGVHQLVQRAIQAAGVDARKRVAEHIYLSGGVTLLPGFVRRLHRELTRLNEPRITPKVHASSERRHCTFLGACRVAAMDAFTRICLTREEYCRDPTASLHKFSLCL